MFVAVVLAVLPLLTTGLGTLLRFAWSNQERLVVLEQQNAQSAAVRSDLLATIEELRREVRESSAANGGSIRRSEFDDRMNHIEQQIERLTNLIHDRSGH